MAGDDDKSAMLFLPELKMQPNPARNLPELCTGMKENSASSGLRKTAKL